MILQTKVKKLYLDFINNFDTVEEFATYYKITIDQAVTLIKIGKALIKSS